MTIQDLGSLGEIIAAVATVATLAYLAMQIRTNTRSVQAASAAAHSDAMMSLSSMLVQSEEASAIWETGLESLEALAAPEKARFNQMVSIQLAYWGQAEELETAGTLSTTQLHTRDAQIRWHCAKPGFQAVVREWADMLPPPLWKRVANAIQEAKAAAQQGAAADSA